MTDNIQTVLYTEEQILDRVEDLAIALTKHYYNKDLIVLAIMNGSVIFVGDLLRKIPLPLELHTIAASSYGAGSTSSGTVKISGDLPENVRDKHLLILDDIFDSGRTLEHLTEQATSLPGVLSIKTCVLVEKLRERETQFRPDFIGLTIPDEFVVGYGLDYAGLYRNLPCLATLKIQECGDISPHS